MSDKRKRRKERKSVRKEREGVRQTWGRENKEERGRGSETERWEEGGLERQKEKEREEREMGEGEGRTECSKKGGRRERRDGESKSIRKDVVKERERKNEREKKIEEGGGVFERGWGWGREIERGRAERKCSERKRRGREG